MKEVERNLLTSGKSFILAAGGLIWRGDKRHRELVVIFRNRYQDWTLPKGKVQADDQDLPTAALREVKEETGFDTEITDFAGCVCYQHEGTPKVVLFWSMVTKGPSEFEESEEVKRYEWLPVPQALQRLTYPGERELVRRWANDLGLHARGGGE